MPANPAITTRGSTRGRSYPADSFRIRELNCRSSEMLDANSFRGTRAESRIVSRPTLQASSPTPRRPTPYHTAAHHVCAVHGNEPSPSPTPLPTSSGGSSSNSTSFTYLPAYLFLSLFLASKQAGKRAHDSSAVVKATPDHSRVLYYFYLGN